MGKEVTIPYAAEGFYLENSKDFPAKWLTNCKIGGTK